MLGRAMLTRATVCCACASKVHRRFGRLPWARLVAPAADLARHGFAAHPYLVYVMAGPLSFQRIQVIWFAGMHWGVRGALRDVMHCMQRSVAAVRR